MLLSIHSSLCHYTSDRSVPESLELLRPGYMVIFPVKAFTCRTNSDRWKMKMIRWRIKFGLSRTCRLHVFWRPGLFVTSSLGDYVYANTHVRTTGRCKYRIVWLLQLIVFSCVSWELILAPWNALKPYSATGFPLAPNRESVPPPWVRTL